MRRKHLLALAGVATLSIAAAPATATTSTPTSESGATAAEVDGVATVSGTSATRDGSGGGTASSTVVGVGGEQVVGGSQEGQGENGGEVVTTGEDNEQGHLTVGGWEAEVDGSRSSSSSSVAHGNLGGSEGATVSALDSSSSAEDGRSSSSTTGATIDLGGGQLHLELLKASAASDGTGESWLLMANDEKIATSGDADGQCEIPADPVAHLLCLYATATEGEDGATGAAAGVADVTALDENVAGGLFTADAGQAPAGDDVAAPRPPAGGVDGDPILGAPSGSGSLPRTGGGLLLSLAGLATMGAGAGLRRLGRSS